MAPLIVMLSIWLVLRLFGWVGLGTPDSWIGCLPYALGAMFLFTGVAHFTGTRADLIRMVPPGLPRPDLLVTLTGILELAGAAGLFIHETRSAAAWGLAALLVLMFPANFYAAHQGLRIAGRKAPSLWFRLPLQLFWIGCLWWVA